MFEDLRRQLHALVPERLLALAGAIPPGYDAHLYAARLLLTCEDERPRSLRAVDAIHRVIRSTLKAARIDACAASRAAIGKVMHARGILRDLLAATGSNEDEAAREARGLVIALYEGSAKARAQIDALCARVGLDWDTLIADESYCRDHVIQRGLQLSARAHERAAAESRAERDAERSDCGPEPGPEEPAHVEVAVAPCRHAAGSGPDAGLQGIGTSAPGPVPAPEDPCRVSAPAACIAHAVEEAATMQDGDGKATARSGAAKACVATPSATGASGSPVEGRRRRRRRRNKGGRPVLQGDALPSAAAPQEDAVSGLAGERAADPAPWLSGSIAVDARRIRDSQGVPGSGQSPSTDAASEHDPSLR